MLSPRYIILRCEVEDSWTVAVNKRGHIYLGVAECPTYVTAEAVLEALALRDAIAKHDEDDGEG